MKSLIVNEGASFDAQYMSVSLGKYSSIKQAQAALRGAKFLLCALQDGKLAEGGITEFVIGLEAEDLPHSNPEVRSHLRDHPLLKRQKP